MSWDDINKTGPTDRNDVDTSQEERRLRMLHNFI